MKKSYTYRKIRVAQVITGMVLGGGGTVMLSIARNIDRTKFDVDFYCVIEGGILVEEIKNLGYKVKIIKTYDGGKIIPYSIRKIFKLIKYFKSSKYDIVHTHLYKADVIGRIAAIIAQTPCIIKTLHNMGFWKNRRQIAIDRALNYVTDKVICVSEYQRKMIIKQEKICQQKVKTIKHGVDVSIYQRHIQREQSCHELGIDPLKSVVGTVGRFIKEKGHIYFLQAIPWILDKHPNTQFLIVGDGPLRKEMLRFLSDKPFKNMVFLPGLREDVAELLSLMDVFVFPSVTEAFGIAPLEAMAANVPVVCSAIPPLMENVINGKTGLLFDKEDSKSLAENVNKLLRDDAFRKRISFLAREYVRENLSEINMIKGLERLYIHTYFHKIRFDLPDVLQTLDI